MSTATANITAPLAARWAALNVRQQRMLMGGGAMLGLALFFALVWLPLQRAERRLAERLPTLQAQHAAMQRDAEEVKRLRSLPATLAGSGTNPSRAPDVNALRTLFPGAEVTAIGNGRYRVVLADGRFGRWLDGVRGLNGQLVIAELTVTRTTGDGLRIEAVLQAAKAGDMSLARGVMLFIAVLVIALLARMPAAWVVERAAPALRGVQLQNVEGTIWRGKADVTVTPAGLALKDIRWRFQPAGLLALQWRYGLESDDAALAGRANAGFGFGSVTLTDSELTLPARTAGALVPMLSAFSPEGQMLANIRALTCKGERCSGDVKATWTSAALSLAELRPLGDYQVDAVLTDGRADFDVKTLKGTLRAAGKGQFQNGALRFTGELSAPPDQLPRVQGLMRLLGTPDERGVLRINR